MSGYVRADVFDAGANTSSCSANDTNTITFSYSNNAMQYNSNPVLYIRTIIPGVVS